jgi:hypothetical protein
MKRNSAIVLATVLSLSTATVWADHNSLFGDNTGRTVGGAHDDRFDSNTQSSDNVSTMSDAELTVQSLGEEAYYMQGGYPATVVPGTGN